MEAAHGLSRNRIIFMVVVFAMVYVGWGLLLSLQPPFYPSEAAKRGATPSQYGFVFGIANLAAFIFAPIFGRFGAKIGPKLLYNSGAFTQGIVGLSFGFLAFIENKELFLGLSYFLRFMDGVADAAAWGAGVSILMKLFPSKVSTIMAWTEMLFGLGYMLGPTVGSSLYQVGGFLLPFLVVGIWCTIGAVGVLFAIPTVKVSPEIEDGRKKLKLTDLAKHPSIFMPFVDNFICFCGNGMIESMLEPHLKAAGATQTQVGLTFLVLGGVYMAATPITGFVCDRIKYPIVVSCVGNACMALAFVFLGPVPFINLLPSTALIQGSVAIIGFGYALVMVSTFGRAQSAALRKGFNDDLDTYLLISGMWSTAFYFGNFLGPTVAGITVEKYGFRATTIGFFALNLGILLVDICEFFNTVRETKKYEVKGYEQLE